MKHFGKVSDRPPLLIRAGAFICGVALLSASGFSPLRFTHVASAQTATANSKRPLTHQDYDAWRSIQANQISRDGKFVAYASMPEDGDGDIIVRNVATGAEWKSPRGYRPPVPPPDDPATNVAEFQAAQARLIRPVFTADSKFAVFGIEPTKADLSKAKKEKKKPEDMPKNALGILDVATGQVARVERVKNFQVPEDGSGFIAYLLESKQEEKTPGGPTEKSQSPQGAQSPEPTATLPADPKSAPPQKTGPADSRGRGTKKKEYGTDLVLRNLTDNSERTFNDVLDYTLSKDSKTLVFTVSSRKEDANGVYGLTPQSDAAPVGLMAGKGKYQKLSWDEDQTELAFISVIRMTLSRNSRTLKSTCGDVAAAL